MVFCLFCNAALDDTSKPEHILLNSLGGRKTTKLAICSVCNNTFGGTIDGALASQVMPVRNLLQLKSGTGDVAPTLKKVQAGAYKVDIKGDGRFELAEKPFTAERLPDGRWNVSVKVNTEEELNRIVPHIAAKLQIPEDSLRDQLAGAQASRISERPGVIGHALSFGGPEAIRSMVKSALVLWSTLVGNDEVRGPSYEAARRFVLRGDEQFSLTRTHLDSRYFVEVERMKAAFGPVFNLIYVRSDEAGRVVGHFTLYNLLGWSFTLADTGGAPNKKLALVSNPEYPSQWSASAAETFDVPFEWLNRPDYSDEMVRSKARIEAMMKHYFDSSQERAVSDIIDECIKALSLAPDQPLTAEQQAELVKLTSHRLAHHALGLPHVEPITPERLAEIIRKK